MAKKTARVTRYRRADGTWVGPYTQSRRKASPRPAQHHVVEPSALRADPPSNASAYAEPEMQSWYMEMIRQLGTQEAEQTLADRLAIRLGDTLWGRCLREWRPAACRTLDDVAERVEALPLRTKTPPSRLVGTSRWLAWAGFDIGGRGLVEELTAAVAPPPVSDPAHAAFTLRVYGVAVCFIRFGLLGFEHCACAETLAASASPASIAGALRALPNPR